MEYRNKLLQGDCLEVLRQLPDNTFHCCISSPPYYALRDYGVAGQIGLEQTPREYIDKMVAVYREVRRVLRDDGTCWINIGDSYSGGSGGNQTNSELQKHNKGTQFEPRNGISGYAPKNLLLIPQRLAIALQDDGWIIRSDIIWSKPACMPESVQDRPTKAHEYVWLVTKKSRYWYDADAVREKAEVGYKSIDFIPNSAKDKRAMTPTAATGASSNHRNEEYITSRNLRTVWTIPSEASGLPHYAMFPRKLITPMILAGCPRNCCAVCGAGYVREVERAESIKAHYAPQKKVHIAQGNHGATSVMNTGHYHTYHTLSFHPACNCHTFDTTPGLVLDMFAGTGTTALVARDYGRDYTLVELSPEYVDIARKRLDMPYTMPLPIDS